MKKRGVLTLGAALLSFTALATTVTAEPDAFVEYVEATGSQYIDTGVNAATGLKARIDMAWGSVVKELSAGGDDWSMLDARKTSGNTRFYLCHLAANSDKTAFIFGYGYNTWHRTSTTPEREVRHEVLTDFSNQGALSYRKNGAEMLDSGQISGHASDNIDLGINLYLFACNYSGSASYHAHARLYECKIFRKNPTTDEFELVRHFLPCVKGGNFGLYDTVEGKIYESDGDEPFSGPDTELPDPAAFVEYVEADGSTSSSVAQQYVDTGVWGKLALKSRVDAMLLEDSGDHAILAARGAGTGNLRLYMAYHYNKYFCYGDGNLREPKTVQPTNGTCYVIESYLSATAQSVKVNDVELYDETFTGAAYFTTDSTLTLFANNHKGAYVKNPSRCRLHSAKIWDGDELLRDFIPCIATDGQAGLYDTVSRRVFKPAGKAFDLDSQVGPVTNVLLEARPPLTRIEYVESSGQPDYIDLGITAKDGLEMDAVMEWLDVPSDGAFVGARTDLQNNHDNNKPGVRFFLYHHWQSGTSGHRIGYDGQVRGNDQIAEANVKYRIKSHLDAAGQSYTIETFENGAWSNPVETATAYSGPVDTGLALYLFAMNFDGEPKYFGRSRVYSLKIRSKRQNGTYETVRDLIPVNDPLTGGKALWDKVSQQYFRNNGRLCLAGGGSESPVTPGLLLILR